MDLFSNDALAGKNSETKQSKSLRERINLLENVLLWVGYNLFTIAARRLIRFSKQVKKEHGGKLPEDPVTLLTFDGIGRKKAVLFLQDAFQKSYAMVVDTHVFKVAQNLHLSKERSKDTVANFLEKMIHRRFYLAVNEVFGSMRQLWNGEGIPKKDRNSVRDLIIKEAKALGMEDTLMKVVA